MTATNSIMIITLLPYLPIHSGSLSDGVAMPVAHPDRSQRANASGRHD
jgi:hypothetical protein